MVDICEFYFPPFKIKILIGKKKVGKAGGKLWNIFEVWKLLDVKELPTRQWIVSPFDQATNIKENTNTNKIQTWRKSMFFLRFSDFCDRQQERAGPSGKQRWNMKPVKVAAAKEAKLIWKNRKCFVFHPPSSSPHENHQNILIVITIEALNQKSIFICPKGIPSGRQSQSGWIEDFGKWVGEPD